MSDQDQEPDGDENRAPGSSSWGNITTNYDIPLIPDDQVRLWLQNAPVFSNIISTPPDTLSDLSNFGCHSSHIPFPQVTTSHGEAFTCLQLHGSEEGQSRGSSKRKHTSDDYLEMQIERESDYEDVEGEDEDLNPKTSDECKQSKRMRSTEMHNLKERMRRKKINEKMKSLQELIPNCNKSDKASILDDAIQQIKTLQYQIQMMSKGSGFSMFHSPCMNPQPRQQGMQVPSLPSVFPHNGPSPRTGMGYGTGILGMSGMSSSFTFPMSQLGLRSPCLLASTASGSGMAAPGGVLSQAQNPGHFLEPLNSTNRALCYGTSSPSSGSPGLTQGENSCSSQGAPTSKVCSPSSSPCTLEQVWQSIFENLSSWNN